MGFSETRIAVAAPGHLKGLDRRSRETLGLLFAVFDAGVDSAPAVPTGRCRYLETLDRVLFVYKNKYREPLTFAQRIKIYDTKQMLAFKCLSKSSKVVVVLVV